MKKYDFLIIGAGSGGCFVAYYLSSYGKSVAVVDKDGIGAGGSGAAGAFLSPLAGKANPYNTLVNEALDYALDFYEDFIPEAFVKKGLLRVANKNFNETKFYENAAIVEPKKVLEKLLNGVDFYIQDVKELKKDGEFYIFDGFYAKHIILAQGVSKPLIELEYIQILPIFGIKLDITSSTNPPHNFHKNISVSTTKKDATISIGATKQRHDNTTFECNTSCDKCIFNEASYELIAKELLLEASELIKLQDVQIKKIYSGARATIKSYFPTIGEAIDYKNSLLKHPSIRHGTKIPHSLLSYYENIYIINALGSRGFVLAPFVAKILADHIVFNDEIPKHISTHKLFYKKARGG